MSLIKSIQKDSKEYKKMEKSAVLNSTYAYSPTARSLFNPENLEPKAKLVVPTSAPAVRMLPRVQSPGGQQAEWFKMTSLLDPSTPGTNTSISFPDGGVPNETEQTYEHASAPYKLLGRKLDVGMLQIESSYKGDLNVENQLLKIKMTEVLLGEEWLIFNGDSSYDSEDFDGFSKQITTYSGTGGGGYLTASGLQEYDLTLWEGGAEGDRILFCNPRQHKALTDELYGTGSIQQINVASSVANQQNMISRGSVTTIIGLNGNTIKVVPSRYVGTWAYLVTPQNDAGVRYVEMEDKLPMARYDIASTSFSKASFVVKSTVLKMISEQAHYKIGDLSTV